MPALDRLTVRCLEAADHLRLRGTGRALLLLLCRLEPSAATPWSCSPSWRAMVWSRSPGAQAVAVSTA